MVIFELGSIVNFILVHKFCSTLRISLVPPHGIFPEYEAVMKISFLWFGQFSY